MTTHREEDEERRCRSTTTLQPTLSTGNVLWWSRVYGARYRLADAVPSETPQSKQPNPQALFEAIRDNRLAALERLVQRQPHVVFAKRTALYIASFFGRHEIVKWLLARGADRSLRCEGFLPADVAGAGRDHAIDRMKVQFLLGEETRPQVVVCTEDPATIRSSVAVVAPGGRARRLQIHFSEPIEDFIREDLAVSARVRVHSFARLRADLYVVDVSVASAGGEEAETAFIEVPEGAARGSGGSGKRSAASNRLLLRAAEVPAAQAMSPLPAGTRAS